MRILVTGAAGQVGRELSEVCRDAGDDVVALPHRDLDVTDRDAVLQVVGSTRPDAIVHTAAWTAVDACEGDPDRAFRVNAFAPRHIAEAGSRFGAHLVQLSTDYVFDGTLERAYHEWDRPNPRSVYGASKLAGELEVLRMTGAGSTVVRTSWVCGRYGQNMVKTVLRLAAERDSLGFVVDQRGHPTIVADLVVVLRRLALERRPGIFHVTNQGAVSWYEFVRDVMDAAGLDPGRVTPMTTADLEPPRPAPRPANSVLDNAALRLSGLPSLPHYGSSLRRLVETLAA